MREESKKIEKIEQEVKEMKPAEFSEPELDNVAGGVTSHYDLKKQQAG